LGFALFGVPAVAFAVQLTYASKSQKDARYLARHDPLTGLLNRRAFMEQAVQRVGSSKLTGIAFIDVDRFKAINDSQGHGVGDSVLTLLARVMGEQFDENTLLARLGGDEFIIGFADSDLPANGETAYGTLNMLRDRVRHAALDASIGMPVTLSIGYAATTKGSGLEDFMSQADMALYTVKNSGRDGVAVYSDEMGEALKRRKFVQHLVRNGMKENRFLLHYQPLIKASSGEVDGYEALLRLSGPDGDIVPPSEFVPIAENLGLISDIGAWVLRTAIKEVAGLDGAPFVAVNLSVEQFRSGNIVETVKDALADAGLPPERLELEITESLLIDDQDGMAMIIDTFKELGVSIAMDDFGTGYSSLSYLWKYGFDRIKIDKSFIQALEDNPERSTQLIDTVVMLGARLEMDVTAEGIETAEQADLLAKLGCDHLQGFYFGRPAPLPLRDDVPSVLRQAS
jgi:diguanylate cyclase (GGDEF)-like protein